MATETRAGYCNDCAERRKLERNGVNHILHLILTLVTFGLWVFIWILAAISKDPWRCSTCGSKNIDY